MQTLQIDDKWSIAYDPTNNDRPHHVLRYGEVHSDFPTTHNVVSSMFYALLAKENQS